MTDPSKLYAYECENCSLTVFLEVDTRTQNHPCPDCGSEQVFWSTGDTRERP